jgi:4-methyl-5(b-hydroxyethyl)-thiazole monophosphate biosynthesis
MVYLFLADGFEETEAIVTLDILRRAQVEVITVGLGGSEITGSHGLTVKADICEDEAVTDGLEMIVLPGGPGTENLEKSAVVGRFIDHAAEKGLWIGAICAAPSILGHKGLLKGKRAVAFPGYEKELEGAIVCSGAVCEDGRFVTADGAGSSIAFGLALAAKLKGERVACEVGERMQVR